MSSSAAAKESPEGCNISTEILPGTTSHAAPISLDESENEDDQSSSEDDDQVEHEHFANRDKELLYSDGTLIPFIEIRSMTIQFSAETNQSIEQDIFYPIVLPSIHIPQIEDTTSELETVMNDINSKIQSGVIKFQDDTSFRQEYNNAIKSNKKHEATQIIFKFGHSTILDMLKDDSELQPVNSQNHERNNLMKDNTLKSPWFILEFLGGERGTDLDEEAESVLQETLQDLTDFGERAEAEEESMPYHVFGGACESQMYFAFKRDSEE